MLYFFWWWSRLKTGSKSIPHSYARRSRFAWTLYRKESGSFDVTRDDSERRFLEQHSVFHCWNNIVTIRNNVATLCCAKNRCCESSRVITLAMAIIKKQWVYFKSKTTNLRVHHHDHPFLVHFSAVTARLRPENA